MFGRNYINGSVEWIGFPNLLRNDGPPWTLNILAPYANLGDIQSSTSTHWGSGSEGHCGSVSISWNCPTCVLPVYHRRIFEKPAVLRVAPVIIFLWRTACTACKTLPLVATPSVFVWLTDGMTLCMISRSIICVDNFLWQFQYQLFFLSFRHQFDSLPMNRFLDRFRQHFCFNDHLQNY